MSVDVLLEGRCEKQKVNKHSLHELLHFAEDHRALDELRIHVGVVVHDLPERRRGEERGGERERGEEQER